MNKDQMKFVLLLTIVLLIAGALQERSNRLDKEIDLGLKRAEKIEAANDSLMKELKAITDSLEVKTKQLEP